MKNSTQTERALNELSDEDLDQVTGGAMHTPIEFWVAPRINDMDSDMGFKAPSITDMDSEMG